jgi:hypothetical protein
VYILSRPDGTPYLTLVGKPDAMHGWERWRGYEVFGLLEEAGGRDYVGPTPDTPHDAIVTAALGRFIRDTATDDGG